MLVKLTPSVNFTNTTCLHAAFSSADPIHAKRQSSHQSFALLGSAGVKAGLSSSSGLNLINVLRTACTREDPKSVRIQSNPQYLFTLLGSTCAKAARRTLMKSTPD